MLVLFIVFRGLGCETEGDEGGNLQFCDRIGLAVSEDIGLEEELEGNVGRVVRDLSDNACADH